MAQTINTKFAKEIILKDQNHKLMAKAYKFRQ